MIMKHKIFLSLVLVELAVLGVLLVTGQRTLQGGVPEMEAKQELVSVLGLTDLALWSEARYTRHPSQADFFTPFQDFPGAIDHFPAGSIISPGAPWPQTRIEFK